MIFWKSSEMHNANMIRTLLFVSFFMNYIPTYTVYYFNFCYFNIHIILIKKHNIKIKMK